jgi:hypothetical protein
MRTVACEDVASDPVLLEKTLGLFKQVGESATPTSIMLPRLLSPAVIKQTIAGGRLYMIFNRIVEHRKKTGERLEDPLQFLIDQGDNMKQIIGVCLETLQ